MSVYSPTTSEPRLVMVAERTPGTVNMVKAWGPLESRRVPEPSKVERTGFFSTSKLGLVTL